MQQSTKLEHLRAIQELNTKPKYELVNQTYEGTKEKDDKKFPTE